MVIGLIGPKLSGKGTAADYLVEHYDATVYHMSGILTQMAERLHLPNTRANLIAMATGLREQFGEDILAQTLKKDIEKAGDTLAVIDGIRMPSEVELFSQLEGFALVYIDADLEQRYTRAVNRGEKDGESEMSFDQFKEEEGAVTEQGVSQFREQADARIDNYHSLDEFHQKVQQMMKQLTAA